MSGFNCAVFERVNFVSKSFILSSGEDDRGFQKLWFCPLNRFRGCASVGCNARFNAGAKAIDGIAKNFAKVLNWAFSAIYLLDNAFFSSIRCARFQFTALAVNAFFLPFSPFLLRLNTLVIISRQALL